jgi:adenylate kinase/UMP-CMP kinase
MRENRDTPFALKIQDKLDNQGFLTSTELNPFIGRAIRNAINTGLSGILVDGFPRNSEQLESWNVWPFHEDLPLAEGLTKPDVVISLRVSKQNAKERYASRARDSNDSDEKFERRFAEYEVETIPVEETYRQRGVMVDVSMLSIYEETESDACRLM